MAKKSKPTARRLTPAQRTAMIAAIRSGKAIAEIADAFDVARTTVYWHKRKASQSTKTKR